MTTTTFEHCANRVSLNRQNLLDSLVHHQSAETILDANRFGACDIGSVPAWIVRTFAYLNDSSALYPTCAELMARGYDVDTMALALECGAISPEGLGDLIDSQGVDAVNMVVLTELLRHYDGCEIDMGALRDAGYDDEPIATALYRHVISKPQLLSMIARLTVEDLNTAVSCLLDRAAR